MIVSLLELQARGAASADVKEALLTVARRVRIQADAYRHLEIKDAESIDARTYLCEICHSLEKTVSGVRRIEIECLANPTPINADKALALGLIANELVTNSLKYAFSEEKQGTVSVVLDRDGKGLLRLAVRDDGSGCPGDASPGLGTSIVDAW